MVQLPDLWQVGNKKMFHHPKQASEDRPNVNTNAEQNILDAGSAMGVLCLDQWIGSKC